MKISVREAESLRLEQIRAFLDASEEVHFEGEKREEIYGWISRTLQVHGYRQLMRCLRRPMALPYLRLNLPTARISGYRKTVMHVLVGSYIESLLGILSKARA